MEQYSIDSLQSLDDDELILLVQRRQEAALGALYDRYIRMVYAVALRITGDALTAEEVVQDVFQNVWQAAAGYQHGASIFSKWLLAITRHRAIDVLRSKRERARTREQALYVDSYMPMDLPTSADSVEQHIERESMRQALQTLPTPQRQAIELAYYSGFSQAEIAQQLGEPLGTIKTRTRLGLLKLRELLYSPEH